MEQIFFDSIVFGKIKVAKQEFYDAKNPIKIQDIKVDDIVISKLVETKNNSKYLTEDLGDVEVVLILPKMNGHVKKF